MKTKMMVSRCCCPDGCTLCGRCMTVKIEGVEYVLEPTAPPAVEGCVSYKIIGTDDSVNDGRTIPHPLTTNCPFSLLPCADGTQLTLWFAPRCCVVDSNSADLIIDAIVACSPTPVPYPVPPDYDLGALVGQGTITLRVTCNNECNNGNMDLTDPPPSGTVVCNVPVEACVIDCPTGCEWNYTPDCPTSWSDINNGVSVPPLPTPNCGFHEEDLPQHYAADGNIYLVSPNVSSPDSCWRATRFDIANRAAGQMRTLDFTTNMSGTPDTLPTLNLRTVVFFTTLIPGGEIISVQHEVTTTGNNWIVFANNQQFSGSANAQHVWNITETLVSLDEIRSEVCSEKWTVSYQITRDGITVHSWSQQITMLVNDAVAYATSYRSRVQMVGRDMSKWGPTGTNYISAMSYNSGSGTMVQPSTAAPDPKPKLSLRDLVRKRKRG